MALSHPSTVPLTEAIIGAAIEVHRHLGPGLLESSYQECLCWEMDLRGLCFQRQIEISLEYKGRRLVSAYRIDLVVEHTVVIEVKSIERILPVHGAQVLTYMRLMGLEIGLLVNFNSKVLIDGVRRFSR